MCFASMNLEEVKKSVAHGKWPFPWEKPSQEMIEASEKRFAEEIAVANRRHSVKTVKS